MAVTTTNSVVDYVSNGSSVSFSVPFPFLDDDHIRVSKIDLSDVETVLTLGSNYTVAGGDPTGTVTLTAAVTSGWTVRIMRVVPLAQPVEFRAQGPFSPDTWEAGLDRLEMQIQQLNDGTILASSYIYDHGNQAGGDLHAVVTAEAAGFATPAMLAHVDSISNPHGVTREQIGAGSQTDMEAALADITTLQGDIVGLGALIDDVDTGLTGHIGNTSNPHSTTFASLLSKPTTLAGFGITDGATDAELAAVNTALDTRLDTLEGYGLDTRVTTLEGFQAPRAEGRYAWNSGLSRYDFVTGNDPHGILPALATRTSVGLAKLTWAVGGTYRVTCHTGQTTDTKAACFGGINSQSTALWEGIFWSLQAAALADVSEFSVVVYE